MPPTRKLTEEETLNLIDCIGSDKRQHKMVAWENKCLCGVPIRHKRTRSPDNKTLNYECSCYECDCIDDGRYWGE